MDWACKNCIGHMHLDVVIIMTETAFINFEAALSNTSIFCSFIENFYQTPTTFLTQQKGASPLVLCPL